MTLRDLQRRAGYLLGQMVRQLLPGFNNYSLLFMEFFFILPESMQNYIWGETVSALMASNIYVSNWELCSLSLHREEVCRMCSLFYCKDSLNIGSRDRLCGPRLPPCVHYTFSNSVTKNGGMYLEEVKGEATFSSPYRQRC